MHHFIITVLNFYLCESATSLLLAIIQQEQSDNSSRLQTHAVVQHCAVCDCNQIQILRLAHIIHYLIVYSEHHNLTTVVWYQNCFSLPFVLTPQVFRDEFVSSSDLETLALHQCLSNGCSAVNGCRQNESLINNITIIHTTPVSSDNIWRRQELRVCKKHIHQDVFNFNHCFWLKYESIFITELPPVKKWSEVWIRREICTDQAAFTNQNSSKQICVWI